MKVSLSRVVIMMVLALVPPPHSMLLIRLNCDDVYSSMLSH